MPSLAFDHYLNYAELTDIVHAFAKEYPTLCAVQSIGKSYEGRDIWLVTLTNTVTGDAADKPAFWVDANIHATEVSPATCALNAINKALTGFGDDAAITHLMNTRALYVVPRVNPDGAELYLQEGRRIRSSTRAYPLNEAQDGLYSEDVDGDGRRLVMRVKDANGPWRAHPDDARLMVARAPDDIGAQGPYFRLLPEGLIRNYDGALVKIAPNLEGLDLNRNFPLEWAVESEQAGAGPYPTSEPEVRAMVQFIVDHPNICGGLTFHTYSGVYLRPYGTHPDDAFPADDLWMFQEIGKHVTRITGYPAVSVYHDFRYHPKETIKGVFDDWMYEHVGVPAWTCELWSPQQQCGIDMKRASGNGYRFTEWWRSHDESDDFKLLKWNDEVLGGRGFVNWYPFTHPQLGEVEIGGWDVDYTWRNPPPPLLEKEIVPHADFIVWHALISPSLAFREVSVEVVGDAETSSVFRVRATVQNTGWLPTNVTAKAKEKKLVRPLEVELGLPDDARLVSGELKVELGQLSGRNDKLSAWIWTSDPTTDRAKAEWVIEAPRGSTITLAAKHQRAGKIARTVTL